MAGYWGRYMGDTPGIPLAKTHNCLVMAGMIRMFWQAPKHTQKKAISTWFIVAPTQTQRTKKKTTMCVFSLLFECVLAPKRHHFAGPMAGRVGRVEVWATRRFRRTGALEQGHRNNWYKKLWFTDNLSGANATQLYFYCLIIGYCWNNQWIWSILPSSTQLHGW